LDSEGHVHLADFVCHTSFAHPLCRSLISHLERGIRLPTGKAFDEQVGNIGLSCAGGV
jgi:hypothetical protein